MEFSKNHISLRTCAVLTEICRPLMDSCGITFFEYSRNYYDNKHLYLSTHPDAAQLMFNENHQVNAICFKHPDKYEFDYSLWDTADSTYSCFKLGEIIKKKYDVAHFLNYVVRKKDYTEVFSFAGSLANTELNNIYLSQKQIFKHFAFYFYDKAEALLKAAEKELLFIPYANTFIDIHDDDLFANNENRLNKFLNAAKIKKMYLSDNFADVALTPREAQCIKPLLDGLTYKQIARQLQISPRTVEDRVEQLRNKFRCANKKDLLTVLHGFN